MFGTVQGTIVRCQGIDHGVENDFRMADHQLPQNGVVQLAEPIQLGHLIAEVLVGIALNDHTSYLIQEATWVPAAEKGKSGFDAKAPLTTMFQLIHWTTGGTMKF